MYESFKKLIILSLASLLTGYALTITTASAQAVPAPEPGKALIVFMRPSSLGGAVKSSVFDITSGKNEIISIVRATKKLTYSVNPGKHLFMVIAENADFMAADVEAGKTYYVLVQVRSGVLKARFSLIPIKKHELDGEKFRKWDKKTRFVGIDEKSSAWAQKKASSIEKKKEKYMVKWNNKSADDKAARTLQKDDGIVVTEQARRPTPTYLSTEEIIEVYSGKTYTGESEGQTWQETYRPHKTLEKALAGKKAKITGVWGGYPYRARWWVKDAMLCADYPDDDNDDCWKVERINDTQNRFYSQKEPGKSEVETLVAQ